MPLLFGVPLWVAGLATVVGIVSAARLTRLVVSDSWPPVQWVKVRWDAWTDKTERRQGWWLLLNCPWCLGPWFTLAVGGWAVLDIRADGYLDWPWWAFNGWLAASYVVSWLTFHDEDGAPVGGE